MLPIFLVISPTIVVYRLLFLVFLFILLRAYCLLLFFVSFANSWCFVKFIEMKQTRPESNFQLDGAAVISCAKPVQGMVRQRKEFHVVMWRKETLGEFYLRSPRASHWTTTKRNETEEKNCLKFHSAEDKRQQSYVYEEQAGMGASKTWKTRYRFVKDWSNNGSDRKKIRFTKFNFAAFSSSAFSRW